MRQNKNTKVCFVMNDAYDDFIRLYKKVYSDANWIELSKGTNANDIIIENGVFYDNHACIYLKGCTFPQTDFSGDCGKSYIEQIINWCKNQYGGTRIINRIFIKISQNGLTSNQFTLLTKKYSSEGSTTSGVYFYNFGKSYVLNKTFFDSGYSVFGNNIAHEAINVFKSDDDRKFFYLCKDGKLNDFIYDENSLKCLPVNYINCEKAELINYSKISEGDKAKYIILQKISNIQPVKVAFDDTRETAKYDGIEYYGNNICDIFNVNSFLRKNKKTGKFEDVTENYPFITFKTTEDDSIKKPTELKSFSTDTEGFESLSNSSCRQFVMEGTNLYNAVNSLIGNEETWQNDNLSTLEEYIESDDYKKDFEENFLLKILGKETKETYFSKLLTFVFANSAEIIQKFLSQYDHSFPHIKAITNIYNEEKNMDVSFTFIDDNDTEYFVVVENKINASFTPEGRKSLEDYFKNSSNKYKDYVDSVKKSFETYKNQTTEKEYNQLTKYHLISSVLAKDLSIDESNIKYYVLAPEYKQDFCNREKSNYYYGEDYTVTSYKELKTAIDEVINIESSVFHTLPSDVKDIIIQFNRSIWPYISDSYTYYKRTMSNRFARTAKALHDKNT